MWLSPTWMKEGGCASVVNATVFEVFNTNPAVAKCRTRLSNKFCTSSFLFAKIKMSSAKRKSSKRGIASPRCTPPCGFASLHSDIANSSAAQNKRGLSTHPCRTPEKMSNVLLSPAPSRTTPVWFWSSSQVSPNARRQTQCKGGGGKEKYMYVHTNDCTTCRRLSENGLKYFVDAKLPTASPNLLYRKLSINPSWWSTMVIQLFCSCPKQDSSSTHVLPFCGLNENRVVPLAENFPMIAPPARGPCRQTPCRKAVCWQWGGRPLPVLRGFFLGIWHWSVLRNVVPVRSTAIKRFAIPKSLLCHVEIQQSSA